MTYKRTIALVLVAIMAMAAVTYAQFFGGQGGRGGRGGGGRGGRRGGFGGYQAAPRRATDQSFTGDFTFCRIAYDRASDGDGGSWGVDYPRADQKLSIRLPSSPKRR